MIAGGVKLGFSRQEKRPVRAARSILSRFERKYANFVDRVVTEDESRIHYYDPETKKQSLQWRHQGSTTRTKFRRQIFATKAMATLFCDYHGALLIFIISNTVTQWTPNITTVSLINCVHPSGRSDAGNWERESRSSTTMLPVTMLIEQCRNYSRWTTKCLTIPPILPI